MTDLNNIYLTGDTVSSLDSTDIETWLREPIERCIQVSASPYSLSVSVCHLYECAHGWMCVLWVCDSCSACLCVAVCLSFLSLSDTSLKQCFDLAMDLDAASASVDGGAGWIQATGHRCCPYWWCWGWSKSHLSTRPCLSVSHLSSDCNGIVTVTVLGTFLSSGIYFDLTCPNIFHFLSASLWKNSLHS